MAEYKDYYKIMGIKRDASQDEIKRAYRKLARRYHPDVSKEADAEARFKEVGEAYEVLKDPQKRAAYDRLGTHWQEGQEFRPPPGWDTGFDFAGGGFTTGDAVNFSDFFETLFGQFGARAGAGRGTIHHIKGEDRHAKVQIDLKDAYHGTTQTIVFQIPEIDAQGRLLHRQRTLNVHIPKGVRPGQRIRLTGQGAPSLSNGPAGDLYLEIEFKRSSYYSVDGRDVFLQVPVTPWEAALGGKIRVPTPDGEVELKIPSGSANGAKLRLRGRGIPGTPSGDIYVVLKIVLPPADSDNAKALYQKMAKELAFNPRLQLRI